MGKDLSVTIIELLEGASKNLKAQPLNLGGFGGGAGGVGAPPGGYIGWLPQTRVAYDEVEAATLATNPSGFNPPSGWSLVDNLNHIRYRLDTLEAGSGVLIVDEWDGSPSVNLVQQLSFSGAVVTEVSAGHALVQITASGGGLDTAAGDARYLKLDASNDPVTGTLSVVVNDAYTSSLSQLATIDGNLNVPNTYFYRYSQGASQAVFTNHCLVVNDYDDPPWVTISGGTLLHKLNDTDTLVDINPFSSPGETLVLFNSNNEITQSGRLLSLQNQGVEKFYVTGSGLVNIPAGQTYNIGGSPHTHDSSGGASYNNIINGGFAFAQRQVAGTLTTIADEKYGADRWLLTRENADVQYNRNDALGETGLTSQYYGLVKKITNAGKFMMVQIVEGTNSVPLRGKSLTFECKMKASASKTIRMAIIELQNAGTIDTMPASIVTAWNADTTDPTLGANLAIVTSAESKSVTTSWTKFSVTKTIPSNSKNVICAIWSDSDFAANDTLSIAEAGLYTSAPTNWIERPVSDELNMCLRYCQRPLEPTASVNIVAPVAFRYSTTFIIGLGRLFGTMRTTPTMTSNITGWEDTASPTTTLVGAFNYTSAANIVITGTLTASFDQPTPSQFRLLLIASTSFNGSSGHICDIRFGPDVILYADAEIY